MTDRQDININAPNSTIIIAGDNQEKEVIRLLDDITKQRDMLLAQIKAKDDLIQNLDRRLKKLEK